MIEDVEELTSVDRSAATALWAEAGLTRPWNSPGVDFDRALASPSSAVLGVKDQTTLVGTVMVGSDGHRGWIYYLAVAQRARHSGRATRLVRAAEVWLGERGIDKVQLMVRGDGGPVRSFYENLGYGEADVVVLSRWLRDPATPDG